MMAAIKKIKFGICWRNASGGKLSFRVGNHCNNKADTTAQTLNTRAMKFFCEMKSQTATAIASETRSSDA